jgi:hypothetical protein
VGQCHGVGGLPRWLTLAPAVVARWRARARRSHAAASLPRTRPATHVFAASVGLHPCKPRTDRRTVAGSLPTTPDGGHTAQRTGRHSRKPYAVPHNLAASLEEHAAGQHVHDTLRSVLVVLAGALQGAAAAPPVTSAPAVTLLASRKSESHRRCPTTGLGRGADEWRCVCMCRLVL